MFSFPIQNVHISNSTSIIFLFVNLWLSINFEGM